MMKRLLIVCVLLILSVASHAQTKWTIVYSDKLYGGVASDIAPITLNSFGIIESVWLESIVAFKFLDTEKQPLFIGGGIHFRLKPTDTGFNGGITLGLGWKQETETVTPYAAVSVRF